MPRRVGGFVKDGCTPAAQASGRRPPPLRVVQVAPGERGVAIHGVPIEQAKSLGAVEHPWNAVDLVGQAIELARLTGRTKAALRRAGTSSSTSSAPRFHR